MHNHDFLFAFLHATHFSLSHYILSVERTSYWINTSLTARNVTVVTSPIFCYYFKALFAHCFIFFNKENSYPTFIAVWFVWIVFSSDKLRCASIVCGNTAFNSASKHLLNQKDQYYYLYSLLRLGVKSFSESSKFKLTESIKLIASRRAWELVPWMLLGILNKFRPSREVDIATSWAGTTPACTHQLALSHGKEFSGTIVSRGTGYESRQSS